MSSAPVPHRPHDDPTDAGPRRSWLLYGAYGYTGRLVARRALAVGDRPTLAGRDERQLAALGETLGLEYRVASLGDPRSIREALAGMGAVAHCAGPFSATASAMLDACFETRTPYLDVTGEIAVLEEHFRRAEDALAAEVAVLPAAGFDVVPSDCLAAHVAAALPEATRLELALRVGGAISPGTAITALETLGAAALGRRGGLVVPVEAEYRRKRVQFADRTAQVSAISWGDVATAYRSTGIPDIVVYGAIPPLVEAVLAACALAGPAIARPVPRNLVRSVLRHLPGPSARLRRRSPAQLWARATAPDGTEVTATMTTPNPYDLTADSVVQIARRLADGSIPPGVHSPSTALGADFAGRLDGVHLGPLEIRNP